VTYSTVPGTALPGFNYVSTTNTLTFNDGDTNKTFTIPLVNNPVAQSAVSSDRQPVRSHGRRGPDCADQHDLDHL
jgi:hypothetical protein